MLHRSRLSILFAVFALACSTPHPPAPAHAPALARYDVREKTLATLHEDLAAGRVRSEELVLLYNARIRALDAAGPALRSVLALNPRAAADARALDRDRAQARVRGVLHGIPVLLKDNIESADPLPTTAGSLALEGNLAQHDAPIVAKLRAAGAIVVGKANLSEWANFRSTSATSGWSAVGGLTKNPYALERNPCGSSSGSAVAVAANLVAVALGTETNGSITCPAAMLGLVGLKPTVGLVSRTGIVPISAAQDTAGPIARTVADAAAVLGVLAGSEPSDPATREADAREADYARALSPTALAGKRFGIMKFHLGYLASVDARFDAAVADLKAAGAEVVEIESFEGLDRIGEDSLTALIGEFRGELNAYLAKTPQTVRTRTLGELIAFNREQRARELPYFEQELFEQAEAAAERDPAATKRLREATRKAAAEGLDALFAKHTLDALIAPTTGPAWVTDLVNGDHFLGGASTLPAVAGYPHLTVPMGQISGLPVGLSFIGRAWSEAALLGFGYAYEQRTKHRRPPPLD